MVQNKVLTLDEAKSSEFCVYEENGAKQMYPVMTVGNQVVVADEWNTWDGTDASLCGTRYRFWPHYPTTEDLAANPWPDTAGKP